MRRWVITGWMLVGILLCPGASFSVPSAIPFSSDSRERILVEGKPAWLLYGEAGFAPFAGALLVAGSITLPDGGSEAIIKDEIRFYYRGLIILAGSGVFDRRTGGVVLEGAVVYQRDSEWWGRGAGTVLVMEGLCRFSVDGRTVALVLPAVPVAKKGGMP